MKHCFEIIFTGQELEATDLWAIIADQVRMPEDIVLYGRAVDSRDLPGRLRARGNKDFTIESSDHVWEFATVAAWDHQMFRVTAEDRLLPDPVAMARSLFSSVTSFVQAYCFDYDYYHWQNASDLIEFRGSGVDVTSLNLIDNGLPPPLNRLIVDTSANPLRRTLRKGYVEMVGSRMWLSSKFFQLLRRDLDRSVLKTDEFQVVADGDLTEVKYLVGDFDSVATADAQNALRRAVYGIQ